MSRKLSVRTSDKLVGRTRRHSRIRKKVLGTSERPRFCVTRGSRMIQVQIIDDTKQTTLIAATTPRGKTVNVKLATELGKDVAKAAAAKGIQKVVFDRGGFIYHGRIAAVASGAREAGLQF